MQSEHVSDPAEPGLRSAKRGGSTLFQKGGPSIIVILNYVRRLRCQQGFQEAAEFGVVMTVGEAGGFGAGRVQRDVHGGMAA